MFATRASIVLIALSRSAVLGFTSPQNNPNSAITPYESLNTKLHGSVSKWNEEHQSSDEDEEEGIITKEMFMRDMLSEPARTKKRRSKGEYKSHDNGDALPFVVRVKTPDPYTTTKDMLKDAKKNSEVAKKNGNKKSARKSTKSNLVGMDSKFGNGIAASIFSRKKDGSLYQVLGSFELDKDTNCGDLVQVGDREFEVVSARAQFK